MVYHRWCKALEIYKFDLGEMTRLRHVRGPLGCQHKMNKNLWKKHNILLIKYYIYFRIIYAKSKDER